MEILAPTGSGMAMVRVAGKGKLMFSIDGTDISITNVRTGERKEYTPKTLLQEVQALCPISKSPEQAWLDLYGRPMETGESEPPKPVEILTKSNPPKPERIPEKQERTIVKDERVSSKTGKTAEKDERMPEKTERMSEKAEDATQEKKEEVAPAQEWISQMRSCFERALQAAEEGRWVAWEGHMVQAQNIANMIRKAQESREIPGQISMNLD